MQLYTLTVGMIEANCYIVVDESSMSCVVIDPGGDGEKIISFLKDKQLCPAEIWITHGHMDHFKDALRVKDEFSCRIRMHKEEVGYLNSEAVQRMLYYKPIFDRFQDALKEEDLLTDGCVLSVGSLRFQCIEVPGHTDHSLCFYEASEKVLFSGDTLFHGSVGRTDLYNGRPSDLPVFITGRLMVLPDDVKVYCGHGPSTDIGFEKRYNPYL